MTGSEASLSWLVTKRPDHSFSLGFDTLYTILDFDLISPMTNGHLHTWGFSFTGFYRKNGKEIFYQITPVLSVSSNALKNPEIINSESFRLETALIYQNSSVINHSWVFGFKSDNRLGDYRLYPLGGLCWSPSDSWLLQLALPDFSLQKTFSNGMNLTFYSAPYGNSWHVFSRDLQSNSELTYNSMVTGISAEWTFKPTVKISVELERHTAREFSLLLDDNSSINPDAASSTQLKLTGKVLF